MPAGSTSKVTTRGGAKSENDTTTEPTLQSLDSKLNDILGMLTKNSEDIIEIKNEQKELGSSVEMCHASISDLKGLFNEQHVKINNCEKSIEQVKSQNALLTRTIDGLKDEINSLEQYSHRNNLVIYGIPEEKTENIYNVLRRLATALHFPDWSNNLIDAVHRMGQSASKNPRPIIVKFVSRIDRDEFLYKRKVRRNLNAKDLGYSSEQSVYINESLTPANRELLRLTRERAKQRNYTQVWTSNCSIYVRKEKGKAPAIKIKSVRDLDNL